MRRSIATIMLLSTGYFAAAQNASVVASQNMELTMAEVVSVNMFSPGGGTGGGGGGSVVTIPYAGINAMADGMESPEIEVTLQGTTNFEISVKASANTFTYSGTSTTNNSMQVKDVLSIIVSQNNTGGTVASGFGSYQALDGTNALPMIDQGQPGVRSFAFKYKATPGFEYAAGTYTADIVYTITKL